MMESSDYNCDRILIRPRQPDEDLPLSILLLADPNPAEIERYADHADWWLAEYQENVVGVCGVLQRSAAEWEIMNIAVLPEHEGKGIGRQLIQAVSVDLVQKGIQYITICTGNSSMGPLSLYQKQGFRIVDIDPDYFVRHYDDVIMENGIQCRDRIILKKQLQTESQWRHPRLIAPIQSSVTIRIAQIRDAGPLVRMKKRLDEQTTFMLLEPGERSMSETEQRDMIRYALRSANSNIFLAELDGQVIGYLEAIGGKVSRNRHSVYIVVGVLQEHANQGVGRRLFHTMLHWAEDRGIHRVELTVQSGNKRGIYLYRSLGFCIEGVQKNALRVDDDYVDLIQMGLLL